MTDREKLRNMDNEELANFFREKEEKCSTCSKTYICKSHKTCNECIAEWLDQEVVE